MLSSKTDEFAAKYRMKQMTKNNNLVNNMTNVDSINGSSSIADTQGAGSEIDTF